MPLPQRQGPQLAEIIATAFHDYPPFRQYIHAELMGTEYRAAMLESFRFYVDLAFAGGDPVTGAWDEGRLVGGILFRTPNSTEQSPEMDAAISGYRARVSPRTFARFEAFEDAMAANMPRLDSGYYYIDTLAVDPVIQNRGYGRQLIEYVIALSRKDPASSAVCLSTELEGNHGLYERLGFAKVSAKQVGPITTTSFILHTDQGFHH